MSRRTLIFMGLFGCLLLTIRPASGVEFHVALTGKDTNPGTLQQPFATLEAARDAIRKIKPREPTEPMKVIVHNGMYFLRQPFVLRPEDSGVTYRAAESGKAILSGGQPIRGWKPGKGKLWQVEIPEVRQGKWYFHALFVNGQRCTRARIPHEGYLRMEGPAVPYQHSKDNNRGVKEIRDRFKFRPGDLNSHWRNLDDVNVFLYHSWTNSLHWLKSIDDTQHIVYLKNPTEWPVGWWEKEQRYYVENVREGLDSPGDWYLDRKTGLLEYWPLPGEDMTKAEVIAPVLNQLLQIEGDWQAGRWVKDSLFYELSFQHTDWSFPSKLKTLDGQSAAFLQGAIQANGAQGITFANCEIAHVGEYALFLNAGCKQNRIQHCEIHDMGAGGIRIGETMHQHTPSKTFPVDKIAVPELTLDSTGPRDTGHNVIDNNFIHDGGHIFAAGTGVFLGHSGYNCITHNEICDLRYSGICVGWVWGFGQSAARGNHITDNHIHHLGWGVLSDMAGVYTLGPSPGTVVAHNLVHHVCSYSYGGWGLYTDEGSSDIVLENNVVYDTKSGGFHQHYGADNTIRNNIFAFSRECQIRRSREDVKSSLSFEYNLVYCDNDQVLGYLWLNGDYHVDYNVYWTTSKATPLFGHRDFAEWQATGQDQHSLLADPRFVDPAQRDFRLQPDSPAAKVGFQPIDLADIGLQGDAEWVAMPKKVVRPEFILPETAQPMPDSIRDDFEQTSVGELPRDARVMGEGGEASIRVSDEFAASGKHALKIVDAPGLPHVFDPHMYYTINCRQGLYRASFDVRPGQDFVLNYEWRDTAKPYHAGPTLRIEANGDVKSGKRKLTTLPADQWAHIEVRCGVGTAAQGTFDAIITVPGQPPQQFLKLPCGNKNFNRLQWLGFSAIGEKSAVTYLDNISLEPVK